MPLGLRAIQTERMRAAAVAADEIERVCAANRETLAGAGDRAFRAGAIRVEDLPVIVALLANHWKPAPYGAPGKGAVVLATSAGGHRLTLEELPRFFAVQAPSGAAGLRASAATIGRFLQVYGCAHLAARGRPESIVHLLRQLIGACPSMTASGLLAAARGRREDPGPDWAKPLRRDQPPATQARHLVARMRRQIRLMGWPEAEAVHQRGRAASGYLAYISAAEIERLHAEMGEAAARARRREAAQRAAPGARAALRPHPVAVPARRPPAPPPG